VPFNSALGTTTSGLGNLLLGSPAIISAPSSAGLFIATTQVRFRTAKVVRRSTNQLITEPQSFDMALSETFPYVVDVTNYLGTNDSISSISPTLSVLSTGRPVTTGWNGGATSQGNLITVPIICSNLSFGQQYQISVTFIANSTKISTYTSIFSVVS